MRFLSNLFFVFYVIALSWILNCENIKNLCSVRAAAVEEMFLLRHVEDVAYTGSFMTSESEDVTTEERRLEGLVSSPTVAYSLFVYT